jgi:L-threonylcarbamoyladenylate synthase
LQPRTTNARPPRGDAAANIDNAIAALKAGRAIVFPTETFYALGVDATNPHALDRLFEIKRRDPDKPVALIAADLEAVSRVVRAISPQARRLAREFWPGPLTMVLPARPELPSGLANREGGVGIRISPHPIAMELARRLGAPLTATSANRSGQTPARWLIEAREALGNAVAAYVDGGTLTAPLPSTVIAFEDGRIRILRAGAVTEDRLNQALRA